MFTGLIPETSARQPVRAPLAWSGESSAKHRDRIQRGKTPHVRERTCVHVTGFLPAGDAGGNC